MLLTRLTFLLIFLTAFSLQNAAAAAFTILQPADQSVFDESFASVVVKIDDPKITSLKIHSDETNETRTITVDDPKRDVYCKTVPLHLGDTTLDITAYAGKKKMQSETRFLFHRAEVFEGCDTEPAGYEKRFFHNDAQESACKKCHNMKIGPESYMPQEDVKSSQCYQCHNRLLSRANSHAPSVNFICMECHDGSSGEHNMGSKGKSKLLVPDPVMKRCFNCHEQIEQEWFNKTSEHGPTRSGRCNKCHNPHSSDHEFFLRKGIWNLCTTCHAEKAHGKHIVSSFVFSRNGGAHPTKGRPDPARPGRELVCSGCHNPHGSDGVFLLRTKGKTPFSVCKRCHKK